jgi:heme exporter protein CcmD
MSEFFEMGGYGAFVWPSFGLTFGIILLNVLLARRSFKAAATEARKRVTIAAQEVNS